MVLFRRRSPLFEGGGACFFFSCSVLVPAISFTLSLFPHFAMPFEVIGFPYLAFFPPFLESMIEPFLAVLICRSPQISVSF